MENSHIKIRRWLYPASWIYGAGVYLRNKLFDWGWLRSRSFNAPVICIGNLAVGGTGKTPHTEYLIRLLQGMGLNVATLSRGYKRKSKGYLLADSTSNALEIGDEPYQMQCKFPHIRVAVDNDRCHGISRLLQLKTPPVDVVLLDDAFQHRYVKAGLNILLTDFHRLLCDDALLPAGMLREPASAKNRAHIIIVTKCPDDIKPIDFNIIGKRLQPYPYQQLFFSRLKYGTPTPLFPEKQVKGAAPPCLNQGKHILLVTGIASPALLYQEIRKHTPHIKLRAFGDHHDFSKKDLQQIKKDFTALPGTDKLIVTTEKDAARLKSHPELDELLKPCIYTLPIEIEILQEQQDIFNQNITDYVRTNSRNCSLPER